MVAHTNLPSLYPHDIERLRLFRRAAEDMYRHLGSQLSYRLSIGAETQLIPESIIRSAAIAIRLACLEKEPAYLPGIVGILHHLKDPGVDRFCSRVAAAWDKEMKGSIAIQADERQFDAKDILDTWLYGVMSHQSLDRQSDVGKLAEISDVSSLALQVTVCGLGLCMLNLDNLVAHVLGEEPLFRPGVEQRAAPDSFFR